MHLLLFGLPWSLSLLKFLKFLFQGFYFFIRILLDLFLPVVAKCLMSALKSFPNSKGLLALACVERVNVFIWAWAHIACFIMVTWLQRFSSCLRCGMLIFEFLRFPFELNRLGHFGRKFSQERAQSVLGYSELLKRLFDPIFPELIKKLHQSSLVLSWQQELGVQRFLKFICWSLNQGRRWAHNLRCEAHSLPEQILITDLLGSSWEPYNGLLCFFQALSQHEHLFIVLSCKKVKLFFG